MRVVSQRLLALSRATRLFSVSDEWPQSLTLVILVHVIRTRASKPCGQVLRHLSGRRLAPGMTQAPSPWLHLCLATKSLWDKEHAASVAVCILMRICLRQILDVHVGDVPFPSSSCSHVSVLLHPHERGSPSKVSGFDIEAPIKTPQTERFARGSCGGFRV